MPMKPVIFNYGQSATKRIGTEGKFYVRPPGQRFNSSCARYFSERRKYLAAARIGTSFYITTMSKAHQRVLYNSLRTKPIAFNPGLARILGDVKAGLLLSQLLYWEGLGSNPDGWIYKTRVGMEAETGLGRKEQERAIKICRAKGVIGYRLMKIPRKRHFKVNMEVIVKLLDEMSKRDILAGPKLTSSNEPNGPAITDSTQQNTQKNTDFQNKKAELIRKMKF